MLDPRAIATLGIGFGADLLAKIGLWPVAEPDQPNLTGWSRRREPRKPREEEEAFLIAVLL